MVHGVDVAEVAEVEVAERAVAAVEAEVEAVVAEVEHLHLVVVLVEQIIAFVDVGAVLPHPNVRLEDL